MSVVNVGDCYAHAINGACNKAVLRAKTVDGGQVESSLKKLREVGTYIKKSSIGLRAFVVACRDVHMNATKIPTPAKTRFTSVSVYLHMYPLPRQLTLKLVLQTWMMLHEMTLRQRAITRMFTNVLHGMDRREPSSRDWAIAKRVCAVLERPCKLVLKSQDKGHWLLPQALDRMCRLYVESQQRLAELRATPPPTEGNFERTLDEVEAAMLETWVEHLEKFLEPLTTYDPTKAHISMALLCDHRHRRGDIFYWMTSPALSEAERLEAYHEIMSDYSNNHLIDAMVAMKLGDVPRGVEVAQQPGTAQNNPSSTPFAVPDILLPCDLLLSGGRGVERGAAEERARVEAKVELERFRSKAAVKESDLKTCPLEWWRANDHFYPMLANVARVALSCPGSQIECERVFSLCGLTVSLLRN